MRIICTISELAKIAIGCYKMRDENLCTRCLMYDFCKDIDGCIEKHVSIDVNDVKKKEDEP